MKALIIKLKRQWPAIAASLLIVLFFLLHTSKFFQWPVIGQFENFLYDTRVVLTMPGGIDERIVIVDIDEKSLNEIGRWPWGRDRLAKLLDELFDYYLVRVVGFDIIFREPDQSSGIRILEQLGRGELSDIEGYQARVEELRPRLDFDQVLSESMFKGPVILAFTTFNETESSANLRDGVLPLPAITQDMVAERLVFAPEASGYGANIPIINDNAVATGHITPTIDEDGVVRRVPMLIEFEGDYYESLSLAMAKFVLGVFDVIPVFAEDDISSDTGYPDLEFLQLRDIFVPVDVNVQALVPYRNREHSYPVVSAVDVIKGRAELGVLQDAIVLVGTSAKGLVDLRPTPVNEEYPGVQIHADMIAGMMDGTIKSQPAYVQGAEFIFLLLTGLLLSLLLPLLSPVWVATSSLLVLCLTIGLNYVFWQYPGLVFPLASSVMMIMLIFLLNMSYGFFIERRGKRQMASLFGQYVPPELVDEMSDDPTAYSQLAQQRELTVLFSDVRSFTTISEGLSPEELSELMNEYLTPMTKLIHENKGTIDKYMGDAIMAFWGAPLKDAEHARHALETGLAMLERLNAVREDFQRRGWPEIRIGVGLNTGQMSVGDMGSQFRQAYTVLGDAVNLGSRLEGLTKGYGVEIIVGEATKAAVPEYVYRELDVVKVKGKDEPIAIYEPLATAVEVSQEEMSELEQHDTALEYYREQEWDKAESAFKKLQKLSPDRKLYDLYLERIAEFREAPPGEDWDGVYTHTTK